MNPTLYGANNVMLRPLNANDLPITLAWRNRDDVRRYFFHSDVISPEQHAAWFDAYQTRINDLTWIIGVNMHPCGMCSLYDITDGRAEFGRMMIGEPAYRGTGTGRIAVETVCKYGLDRLDLHSIYLHVKADNRRAIEVYHDCGFMGMERKGNVLRMERFL